MRYIVNESGEITDELRDGDRILRKESEEFLADKDTVKYDEFHILNTKELRLVLQELGRNEKAALVSLLPYVQYNTCLLAYPNGKCINSGDMERLTNLSRNTVEAALKGLLSKDILCKAKNSREVQWYMNPYIVHRGRVVNKVLKTMFRNYVRRDKWTQ